MMLLEKAGTVTNNSAKPVTTVAPYSAQPLTRAVSPRGGHRPRHGRRLLVAGLHQQRAASGQPAGRLRRDPAEHGEPVGAAVERAARLVVASLRGQERHLLAGHIRRVADQDADAAAQRPRQRAEQVALVDVAAGRLDVAPRARDRGRVDVGGVQLGRPPSATATARPSAPVPQHRSTITGSGPRASETAVSTRNSLRRRGTNTPGSTKIRSPWNSAQPTTSSSGRPSARRSTSRSSSAGLPAAAASSRASSSAKTHPAARSRATTAGSASVVIPMDYACGLVAAATRINRRPHAWHPAPIAVTGPRALLAR